MNRFVSRQIPFACWLLAACGAASGGAAPPDKMAYWGTPRQGANFFNEVESAERFAAARQAGIQFVRLAPNKWLNGRPAAERGDFLLGRPGKFTALHPGDLARLRQVLDDAEAAKIKIVLTMLSLPGSRWKQHNEGVQEVALWQDFSRQAEAVECWRQLAVALRSHPAVVGYDVLNEPAPERVKPRLADWFTGDAEAWAATVRDTPADLSLFYEKLVAAIREADPVTPIILESGFYATPWAFKTLRPVRDDRVLYSFHFYEPYAFTNHRNDGRFDYPGRIPTGESDAVRAIDWNREQMREIAMMMGMSEKYDID